MAERRIRLRAIGPELEQKWESDCLLRIGRSDTLEVVLNDPSISRRHAEVEYSERGWVARDLGSTNGTFVNGVRLGRTERALHKQDLLQCGNVVLTVTDVIDESVAVTEANGESVQVQATARQSLEEAAERLALGLTKSTRPGEQLLNLLRSGQYLDRIDCLDEFLYRNLQDTVAALHARRGAVVLVDEASGKLDLRAVCTTTPELAQGRYYSATLATRCFRGGRSLLCADIHCDPELLEAASMRGAPMGSVICGLLRSPRKPIGVLHLDRGLADAPFTPDDLHLADALAANLSSAIESAQAFQEQQRNVFIQTVIAFSQAIEMRDPYTGGHAQRVTDYVLLLAEEMGLSDIDHYRLKIGAPLHDIGKIGINDIVLRKAATLTPEEFEQMKMHTIKGAAILETIPGLDGVIPIVRNHHERWDGLGYPDGLAGTKIPRLARLVAIADTFDAMTTDRPYRVGLTLDEAFAQVESCAGTQFDPECAQAFIRVRPSIEQLVRQSQSLTSTHHLGKLYNPAKLMESCLCA
jgi:HD-GYP domain-containing protein (c-di-GMP phosphodiesterase class II)